MSRGGEELRVQVTMGATRCQEHKLVSIEVVKPTLKDRVRAGWWSFKRAVVEVVLWWLMIACLSFAIASWLKVLG